MNIPPFILSCATLTTVDIAAATDRMERWLGYLVVDRGVVEPALAASWSVPDSSGCAMALLRPGSGADVHLRLIEGDPVATYMPMRSFGWAAIELCVQDVEAVYRDLTGSPFFVIGPPTPVGGLPTIRPMQVRGPDGETIFLTEILTRDPADGLPVAKTPIDNLFIQVLACRDLNATACWLAATLGLEIASPISIRYSTINKAFGLPLETEHRIATARGGGKIILELDQYPVGATERPGHQGALPPGIAICTLAVADLDHLRVDWITPPRAHGGPLYRGRRAATVQMPEGALLELIEA